VARFCGNRENRDALNEVLITGGDPLTIPKRLGFLVEALQQYAMNIKIMRIATRLPQQAPSRVNNDVFRICQKNGDIRFELATQVNHPVELSFPETVESFKKIRELGVPIYAQNVLLRGVNDDASTLVELYDKMRILGIEPHYLFHCIPLQGMHHMRTTIKEGLDLSQQLLTSGYISGRGKPMFAAMTDIGKIIFYEGTILKRKDNKVLLQSHYSYNARKVWNPSWVLPDASEVDENGLIRVWYLDGTERASK
jgi:lysine 2,3-aminomutase